MPVIVKTSVLLALSNIFMTFAWYAHLKKLNHQKWYIARPSELGDSLVRISPSGAGESNWLHPIKVTTIKDSARGYHAMCFRSL